jgi:hypothetical protein
MVPWPIALIAVVYAAVGTVAAAQWWQALLRGSSGVWVSGAWAALLGVVVAGLAFLQPWARRLAVWTSVLLMVSGLALAVMAAILVPPSGRQSLMGTGLASVQLFIIRYLTRPRVKAWFV